MNLLAILHMMGEEGGGKLGKSVDIDNYDG